MDFESLPLEIKSHIFSYLSIDDLSFKVASVSKKWQRLSRDPHVVQHIEIDCRFNPKDVTQVLVTYNLAQSLKITGINNFNWVLDIPTNNNLRRLDIDRCCFEVENLQILSTRFPMISQLKISDCEYSTWVTISVYPVRIFSSDCLQLFAENCQRLEQVEIAIYESVNEKSFQTLLNLHATTLTKLQLFCEASSDKNFTTLTQCSRVTELDLCCLSNMTDSQLLCIKKLRALRKLSIMGAYRVSTNAFVELFTRPTFPHLYSINLRNCYQLSDDVITLISKSYPNLKSLNLFYCKNITNTGVKSIIENCSVLENLNISMVYNVTGYILTLIGRSYVPRLKTLYIHGCYRIDPELYRQNLIRSNPGLRVVDTDNFIAQYFEC